MQAYVFDCTDPVGADKQIVFSFENYSNPLLIEHGDTVYVVKENEVKLKVTNVFGYKKVDNWIDPSLPVETPIPDQTF